MTLGTGCGNPVVRNLLNRVGVTAAAVMTDSGNAAPVSAFRCEMGFGGYIYNLACPKGSFS